MGIIELATGAVEIADSYRLLATELEGEIGSGGSPIIDCDMIIVVSSSRSEESERAGERGGDCRGVEVERVVSCTGERLVIEVAGECQG